jgi:hypothetical protein
LEASEGARANLRERLARLGDEDQESIKRWETWVLEGVNDLADYFNKHYKPNDYRVMQRLRKIALGVYCGDEPQSDHFKRLPLTLREFNETLRAAESQAIRQAEQKVASLRESHRTITLRWAKATEAMQEVLRGEIEDLERQIRDWEPRTLPITERLNRLYEAEKERQEERARLLAEWPALESREKGEALRRLFRSVRLYWERTFHPARPNPTRARKTNRPGRYSYALQRDRTEWHFSATDSVSSW